MQAGGSRQDQPAVMRRDDGGHDEVEFFGDGELLFGCRHVPEGDVRAGLVVCPSILSDSGANYQREVRLGRQLAAAGIVVQRFHPRGTGHSDGDGSDLTLDSLIDDARAAVALLRERCDVETVMLLGTRFGALVAGAIAARARRRCRSCCGSRRPTHGASSAKGCGPAPCTSCGRPGRTARIPRSSSTGGLRRSARRPRRAGLVRDARRPRPGRPDG